MARAVKNLVVNADGSVKLKTYTIPFRPEYVLLNPTTQGLELVTAAQPTGCDVRKFRFNLSPAAIELIRVQDPSVEQFDGFCRLTVKFDALHDGVAVIEATRGVREGEDV